MPVPTVRRWRDEWARNGIPETVSAEVAPIVSDFLSDAIRIRGKLLIKLEDLLEKGQVNATQVSTAIGILSDKIRAYEALSETKKVEHKVVLPPAEELKELFSGLLTGVVDAARQRAAEIEAFEEPVLVTTYKELPSAEEE